MFLIISFKIVFLSFSYVCNEGNLHLICLQVLLGRSDISGWGAFLKVFTALMVLYGLFDVFSFS